MLLLQLLFLFLWCSLTWGQSSLDLSLRDVESGRVSYNYRKARFPICNSLGTSASISYGKKNSDGSVSFDTSGDVAHTYSGNYASNRWVGRRLERGWMYHGYVTPRASWDSATFKFHCYGRKGHLETVQRYIRRPVHGIAGVLMYPSNGIVAMALLMRHWSWYHAFLECSGSAGGNGRYSLKAVCYAKAGRESQDGLSVTECGAYIPYGINSWRCEVNLQTPIHTSSSRKAVKTYYWPQFEFQKKAESPLSPIVFEAKYSGDGWLTIPYLHLRDSIQDNISFEIKFNTDFSNSTAYSGRGEFVPAKVTDSCDMSNRIENDPSTEFLQSSEYGGYPASRAANGNLNDFTHTKERGDQWWSVYKPDFGLIGVVNIYSRSGYWWRLSKVSIGISNKSFKLAARSTGPQWLWYPVHHAPFGSIDAPTRIAFVPQHKIQNLIIYSRNPTDALSLAEVVVEGSCVKEYRMQIQLPAGLEFVIKAKSHVQITQSSSKSLTSENSYKGFGTIGKDGNVSSSVCESLQIPALQEYFGCKPFRYIHQYHVDKCKKENFTSLKNLLYCISPTWSYRQTFPVDRSYGWVRNSAELYHTEYGWLSSNQVGSLKSGSEILVDEGSHWLITSLTIIAGVAFH